MHNAKYILICGATAPGAREIRLQVSPAFHTTMHFILLYAGSPSSPVS